MEAATDKAPEGYLPGRDIGFTCGSCGHIDKLEKFAETPLGEPLPVDVFQCPECFAAVRRRCMSETKIHTPKTGEPFRYFEEHPDAVEGTWDRLIHIASRM